MKHEQVVPDYWVMFKMSATCLLLVFSGYVLIRMIQAVFWLPRYLEQNQKKLEDLVTKYSEQSQSVEKGNEELGKEQNTASKELKSDEKKKDK